jgi:hypothetical protein
MKKIMLIITMSIGLNSVVYSDSNLHQKRQQHVKPMKEQQIKRLDRKLTKHKAVKRNFKTKKAFLYTKNRKIQKYHTTYDRGHFYDNNRYTNTYRSIRQHGYHHPKRGWILAYRYDRASFYDNEGFFYGYFNKHGFYFENVFYRYDRYYTYRDRVIGRGLFSHRYYMPLNAKYYGFCR